MLYNHLRILMRNKFFNFIGIVFFLTFEAAAQPEQGKDYQLIPPDLIEGQSITEVLAIGVMRVSVLKALYKK